MARRFMDEDFLLGSETARRLYHEYAKSMPIIDYHCHLSPQEIWENRTYRNLAEVWLGGDHYKWRAMRANGVDERYVTGDADGYDKFLAYARTLPQAIGNPLYHWSHLELKRYFAIDEPLDERSAPSIWERANRLIQDGGLSARDLITKSNVEVISTTDDPADSLEYHLKLKGEASFRTKVLPSFRPDKALELNRPGFAGYVRRLEQAAGIPIRSYDDLLAALKARIDFFHETGCRVSDHALDVVVFEEATEADAAAAFAEALQGRTVSEEAERKYKSHLLVFLGKQYAARRWAMQYHMNAQRNNNTRRMAELGPDTGYDSIGDTAIARPLARLLDSLERENALPKTILYSLHPGHNPIVAAMIGNFQGGGIPGKIQFGSAWWFNDTKEGMIAQLKTLADFGLLGRFVGMLTDSRSFLSYTRHEYFRRILCNLIGEWAENGEVPDDLGMLGGIVENISYRNAKAYFDFDAVRSGTAQAP